MNTHSKSTFKVGDIAMRFRVELRGDVFNPHRVVTGVEAVEIVAVQGDRVAWTAGRLARKGLKHIGQSDARELIPLSALENPLESPTASQPKDTYGTLPHRPAIKANPVQLADALLTATAGTIDSEGDS